MKYGFLAVAFAAAMMAQPVPAPGNVTIPLNEYDRLVELASRPPVESTAPPLRHAVKSANITLEVKGESVSGAVLIEGEVLATGTQRVPLVSGLIVRSAQLSGADVSICVFNTGAHIPDYALPRVTERFYSLPRPATGRKSSGLGLSFVREAAELHDGTFQIGNVPGGVEARLTLRAG